MPAGLLAAPSATGAAAAQMALDAALAAAGRPAIRLYGWTHPALTFGRSQPLPAWLATTGPEAPAIDHACRPTGGGMAVHGSDVCVAVVAPRVGALRVDRLLSAVCESAVRLCGSLGVRATASSRALAQRRVEVCLTDPSPYAVLVRGRKVAGFALRRYADACLLQGSLLVQPVAGALAQALPEPVRASFAARAISLEEALGAPVGMAELTASWSRELEGCVDAM